jgi:hypothetical protein
MLRRIFGPKKDEIISWKEMHWEELHTITCTP